MFDPVRELGASFGFYRVTRNLEIDVDDLARQLKRGLYRSVLVIHYFGYPDLGTEAVAALAERFGATLVEDEAHALFSDLVGMRCGRTGAASVLSLHKMFPVERGGLLLCAPGWRPPAKSPLEAAGDEAGIRLLADYDLAGISAVRRRNAVHLLRGLASLAPHLDILRPDLPDGVVPQTLAVVLRNTDRDGIYARMNDSGFGVVSLYHTMVQEIGAEEFPDSHWLSRRILNLPVHQDTCPDALDALLDRLRVLLEAH